MISLTLLADLVVLLLVLGVTALVLLGWGHFTWRLLAIEQPSRPTVLTAWLGFCLVVACLEIIHLFVPIDWKVTLTVSLIGLLGQRLRATSPNTEGLKQLLVQTIKHGRLVFIGVDCVHTVRNWHDAIEVVAMDFWRAVIFVLVFIVWANCKPLA